MHTVFLGLGANLGNPVRQLVGAVDELRKVVHPMNVSSVYRSAPVDYREQPDFLNLVCTGNTLLSPGELLEIAHEIEQHLGRTRSFPNAPRTLDIDILAYGDLVIDTPDLTIPHPRLHERAFVLVPLIEIAPTWSHPVYRKTAAELLARGGPFERVESIGRLENQ